MDSKHLEEKARREREGAIREAHGINEELSPGQMIDRYYFHGERGSLTTFVNRFQEDPVPGALVGAAMAWTAGQDLAARRGITPEDEKNYLKSKVHEGKEAVKRSKDQMTSSSDSGPTPNWEATESQGPGMTEKLKDQVNAGKEKLKGAMDQGRESLSQAKDKVSSTTEQAKGQMSSASSSARTQAVENFRKEPLINVAIGFSLGSALGSMIPLTEQEDRYLEGPAREIADTADSLVHQTKQQVKQQAKSIADCASKNIQTH